jgi:hypothetical protein
MARQGVGVASNASSRRQVEAGVWRRPGLAPEGVWLRPDGVSGTP